MNGIIDFSLLAIIINTAVTVMLIGGLITGYDTAQLVVIGAIGYLSAFVFRRIGRKK